MTTHEEIEEKYVKQVNNHLFAIINLQHEHLHYLHLKLEDKESKNE